MAWRLLNVQVPVCQDWWVIFRFCPWCPASNCPRPLLFVIFIDSFPWSATPYLYFDTKCIISIHNSTDINLQGSTEQHWLAFLIGVALRDWLSTYLNWLINIQFWKTLSNTMNLHCCQKLLQRLQIATACG